MIIAITKIELNAYATLWAFMQLNRQIISELQRSKCKKYKVSNNWNLKVWHTMTVWENENDLNEFYRNGTHVAAMKRAKSFSSNIQSRRLQQDDLISWKAAKKLFDSH